MRATAPEGSLPELCRDEGLCLYSLGRWAEATEALKGFLAAGPDARDTALVNELLGKIQERAAAAAAAAAGGRSSRLGSRGAGGSSSVSEEEDTAL